MADVIVALDEGSARDALHVVDRLGEQAAFFKVGLELFTASGPAIVSSLNGADKHVFLDLKLHDIPNTVHRAVSAAKGLGVDMLTVHAGGGSSMLEAARAAAGDDLRVLAVTLLTSLDAEDLGSLWGREVGATGAEVVRLADLARSAGLDGVVASAGEARAIRAAAGQDFLIVTPGIRPAGGDRDDQKRVATPAEAVAAGADYLVVGRPVTRAADPAEALSAIMAEVEQAERSLTRATRSELPSGTP